MVSISPCDGVIDPKPYGGSDLTNVLVISLPYNRSIDLVGAHLNCRCSSVCVKVCNWYLLLMSRQPTRACKLQNGEYVDLSPKMKNSRTKPTILIRNDDYTSTHDQSDS